MRYEPTQGQWKLHKQVQGSSVGTSDCWALCAMVQFQFTVLECHSNHHIFQMLNLNTIEHKTTRLGMCPIIFPSYYLKSHI